MFARNCAATQQCRLFVPSRLDSSMPPEHQHAAGVVSCSRYACLVLVLQAMLVDVLTCADVQQLADNAHFFVFEEAMR